MYYTIFRGPLKTPLAELPVAAVEREESMGIKNDGGVDGRVGGDHARRCLPADIYLRASTCTHSCLGFGLQAEIRRQVSAGRCLRANVCRQRCADPYAQVYPPCPTPSSPLSALAPPLPLSVTASDSHHHQPLHLCHPPCQPDRLPCSTWDSHRRLARPCTALEPSRSLVLGAARHW
jgi:hypothetical protein